MFGSSILLHLIVVLFSLISYNSSHTASFITLLKGFKGAVNMLNYPGLLWAWRGGHASAGPDLFHCPSETPVKLTASLCKHSWVTD